MGTTGVLVEARTVSHRKMVGRRKRNGKVKVLRNK
jgi:hypothetical protein